MKKGPKSNKWKEHHEFLKNQDAASGTTEMKKAVDEICRLCGWSERTFYRKIDNPASLSISEKITIAQVYKMLAHFLFPEMEVVH